MKGFVAWSIVETRSGKEIGRGQRNLGPSDLTVREVPNPDFSMQMLEIELSPPFRVGFARTDSSLPQRVTGFGFSAYRSDLQSFSWEWFGVASPDRVTNPQEGWLLGIELVGEEVARTEFLTDVSFRIREMSPTANPLLPAWRATILEGSWMSWPLRGD